MILSKEKKRRINSCVCFAK